MEKDVLKELGMTNRSEVLIFLKMLWNEEITQCPKCGGTHKHLHKKAIMIGNAQNITQFIKRLKYYIV